MGNPSKGMYYKDVRERVKRLNKDEKAGRVKNPELKKRLEASLLNQCKLHEGSGAVDEIHRELSGSFNCSRPRNGGFGEGVKGSAGHYEWDSERKEWVKK